MTYAPANYEVGTSNGLEEDAFTRKYIIRPSSHEIAQYPVHHVTYAPAKSEAATSNSYEKMHLQENTAFCLGLGVK